MEDVIVRRALIPLATTVAFLVVSVAGAQTIPAQPAQMPGWDADFSLGLISNSARDEGDDHDGSSVHAEARIDIGHYWTQHLKTEVGVGFLNRWDDYDYETFPVPGLPGGGYLFTNRQLRMAAVTPTFTYQFFENQFAHPYLSAGVRVGFLETHLTRSPQIVTQSRVTYNAPGLDRTDSSVIVRPIAAAGFKSYFNERTFLRTEAAAVFDSHASPHVALRVGFGFDF
jgi:hypothetical protein